MSPSLLYSKGGGEMFKESEHPRDKDGKFTDGSSGNEKKSAEEIAKEIFPHLTKKKKLFRISLQFFADKESDLQNQETGSIRRSMRKLDRRILEHREKIAHPEIHSDDWDALSDECQKKRLEYWENEISELQKSIQRRIEELQRRGEYNE